MDVPLGCALCLVLSLYPFLSLLCPSVTVSCPAWACQRVPLPVPPLPAVFRCSEAAPGCWGKPLPWDHTCLLLCTPFGSSQPWLLLDTASVPCAEETLSTGSQCSWCCPFPSVAGRADTAPCLGAVSWQQQHLPSSSHLPLSPWPCCNLPLPDSLFPTMAIRL